jgi:hypothetical protein
MEVDPNKAIKYIQENAKDYADAKGRRVHLEHFLKTVKAQLMSDSDEKTLGAQEAYAYSHGRYVDQLTALKEAVIQEEYLRYMLKAAELRIEVFKVEAYNMRAEMRATT